MADEFELIGGLEKRAIEIVEYDRGWPARYDAQRHTIERAMGERPHRVQHVGSTAVPGLRAKPIIDIQLAVPDAEDETSYLTCLETAGYVLRVRERGHRMLRTPALDVQIHVCGIGSEWERRHLLLRDWLRKSDEDRRLYGDTKTALAAIEWPTMNDYADAKSAVIAQITERAEQWATIVGWEAFGVE